MKYEWKKQEKALYSAGKAPTLKTIPAQSYIMISGRGDPNDADFSNRVSALYSLAYAVKMAYKANALQKEISDFAVYPLEGIWSRADGGPFAKEKLEYTIMIRQPDFISEEMVAAALERGKAKKPGPLLKEIRYEAVPGGLCVEILHTGPFDEEPASFAKMDSVIEEHGLKRLENCHREIYLSNANRTPKSRLKTILRYSVG